jgi:maltooligosyltrehalose trehalohydrolase
MNQLASTSPRTLQREQEMKFGTRLLSKGVLFRLWAPMSEAVSVKIYDLDVVLPMSRLPRGWYEVEGEDAEPGMRYRFVLEDGSEVPDPASRFQPDDVHGPSEIVDPRAFGWTDASWRGRPW